MGFWLFEWWKSKRQRAIIDAAIWELEQLLEGLRESSSDELSMAAASVADAARRMADRGIDTRWPALTLAEWPELTTVVTGIVLKLQGENNGLAALGWLVWAHTFRAEDKPMLRRRVQEMWSLLSSGFEDAALQSFMLETGTGQKFEVLPHLLFVPAGCELHR